MDIFLLHAKAYEREANSAGTLDVGRGANYKHGLYTYRVTKVKDSLNS